ncbi:D-alanyl-D-alanine carboxypeptidase family protein [Alteribacillus sp. HJP-4]|uniref:M15 family metallopeptidase n=1 Tax=Alteribacillus sp. HJP-4 TaxID=2775394 RepID=UPI0035CCF48C
MKKRYILSALVLTLAISGCTPSQSTHNESNNTEKKQQENETEDTEHQEPAGGSEEVTGKTSSKSDEGEQENDAEEENSYEEEIEAPEINDAGELKKPDDTLALVNREFRLPGDYEPEDLMIPDIAYSFDGDHPKKQVREPVGKALEELFAASKKEGLKLFAVSGYRSYERQEAIFNANSAAVGVEKANNYSAKPGESEHQSGLAMDVSSPAADFGLTNAFGNTPEGEWLKKHAHDYGFIIRYPEDKTDITGYQYEPWHLRYVGKDVAAELHKEDLTLEEYYGVHE